MRRPAPSSLFAALGLLVSVAPAAAGPGGRENLGLIPAPAALILHVDVTGLMATPIGQELVTAARKSPALEADLARMAAEVGLDVERDIRDLTIALPALGPDAKDVLFVVGGRFDEARIVSKLAADKKLQAIKQGAHTLYQAADGNAMAFAQGKALAGTTTLVRRGLDGSAGAGSALADPAVSTQLDRVDTSRHLWLTAAIPATLRAQMGAQGNPAAELESLALSADLKRGLDLAVLLGTTSPQVAAKAAQDLSAQLALQAQNPMAIGMGITAMLAKVKVVAKGKDVELTAALDAADVTRLRTLVQTIAGLAHASGGAGPRLPPPQRPEAQPPADLQQTPKPAPGASPQTRP